MTEREITEQRIIFLKDRQTLFIRETDFKIGILKDKLRKITTAYKMPKQKQRATNFDYKNEVEVGDPERGIDGDCKFCGGEGCLACSAEPEKAYKKAFPKKTV